MNWKNVLMTALLVMVCIYLFKWVNTQVNIPVLGTVIEGV